MAINLSPGFFVLPHRRKPTLSRILIVASSPEIQKVLKTALMEIMEDQSFNVVDAENGFEAVAAIKASLHYKHPFNLVIIDDQIRGKNSQLTARDIRYWSASSKILLYSDNAQHFSCIDGILQKPLNSTILQNFLHTNWATHQEVPERRNLNCL